MYIVKECSGKHAIYSSDSNECIVICNSHCYAEAIKTILEYDSVFLPKRFSKKAKSFLRKNSLQ